MKRRLSILMSLVFLFTAVFSASFGAVYAAEDDDRIAGNDRYETACEIAKLKYSSADTVIIVRGDSVDNVPQVVDGLTASVLAGAKDAPILLTDKNVLPEVVADTIEELGAENAYIIGGTNAVSEDVEEALEDLGLEVERIEGEDRFETAVNIAKEANTGSKTAIVTQAFALVDSLVAGPLAHENGYPILLVWKDKVGEVTEKAIEDLGIENIIIIGGEGVIPEDVEDELDDLVSGSVVRLAGEDRFETSLEVAKELDKNEVVLVNGMKFVDAVPASVLGLPILYVEQYDMDDDIEDFIATKAGVKIIGGEVAISDDVADRAREAVQLSIVSVSAVGAKKIEVRFSKAVDPEKATFEVKRGTVKPSIKSITFAEDKKSAVIEFNVALASGDYTVTVTGLRDEALTGQAKIEAAKLTTIEFTNDFAVISNVDATEVKVGVVAKNQYGEEISNFTPNISASKGTGSWASNVLTLTVTSPSVYTVGEKVVVTIVDPQTGVVASKTLTVAQAAQVESIKIGELKTDDPELAAKPINVSNLNNNLSKYYIPVEIKDQYGNTLKAGDLIGVNILSSNTSIINPKGFKDLDNGTTVIELDTATGTATSGTAVITLVAAGTGKTASATVTVLADAKIDVVQLSAPETELKIGKAAVLPITVIDTYGNEIALKDIAISIDAANNKLTMNTDQATLTFTNATLATKTNYTTGVTTIEITPTDKNIVLTVTTSTGKFQTLTLTALDAPVPVSIKGMKSSFVSMLANDTSMKTSIVGNVEFLDQYGEAIDVSYGAPADDDQYGYTVTPKDTPDNTTVNGTDIEATATPGTDVYVVKLLKGTTEVLDELEVPITVVDKDKITEFGIEDLNKFYTGAADTKYNQQVKIYGLVGGKKVAVPQNMIKMVTATNGLPIDPTTGQYTAQVVDTKGNDVTSTITVLVEAGSNTYTVTKDVVYSSAAPKAQSLVFKKDGNEVTIVEVAQSAVATGANIYDGIDGLEVVAKDQYNVELNTVVFAVTNNDTGATISIDGSGDLTVTGTPAVSKSFQIHASIDGLYKSVKVIVKE